MTPYQSTRPNNRRIVNKAETIFTICALTGDITINIAQCVYKPPIMLQEVT